MKCRESGTRSLRLYFVPVRKRERERENVSVSRSRKTRNNVDSLKM